MVIVVGGTSVVGVAVTGVVCETVVGCVVGDGVAVVGVAVGVLV